MTQRTPPRTSRELLERLDELMDSVPIDDQEADQILREAGINASDELRRAMSLVDEAERKAKQAKYGRAEAERTAALEHVSHPRRQRSRAELDARIAHIRKVAPPEAQPQAYWKNFESAPLEDLERMAVERALRLAQGNRTKAAALLGISRDTLYRKLREYKHAKV